MTTITVWLLIAGSYNTGRQTSVVERFATLQQCEHVVDALRAIQSIERVRCIQATVVKP